MVGNLELIGLLAPEGNYNTVWANLAVPLETKRKLKTPPANTDYIRYYQSN